MAQTYSNSAYPFSYLASNKNLFVGGVETVILEQVPSGGFSKISLTITNYGASNISVVKIYGSNDGINYFTVNASALSTITPASTVNVTISPAVATYFRVTATSAGTSNFDCYLVGTP